MCHLAPLRCHKEDFAAAAAGPAAAAPLFNDRDDDKVYKLEHQWLDSADAAERKELEGKIRRLQQPVRAARE
jgi:hypothetical protein